MNRKPVSKRRQARYKAKRLFYTHNYTQKQIAEMVGVTQAVVSGWVQRYGWKNPDNAGLRPKVDVLSGVINTGFVVFLKEFNPSLLEAVESEIRGFMKVDKSITLKKINKINQLVKNNRVSAADLLKGILLHSKNRTGRIELLTMFEADNLFDHILKDNIEYPASVTDN